MNINLHHDWEKLREQARIVDLHAHPDLKPLLLRQSLSHPIRLPGFLVSPLNAISVQTSFPNLQSGGIDVLFSTAYPPEKRLFEDIKLLGIIPLHWIHNLPISPIKQMWAELVAPAYFTVANTMLDDIKKQVDDYNSHRTPAEREVRFVYSSQALKQCLEQVPRPIIFIHSVEGGHSLEGEIGLRYLNQPWDRLSSGQQSELEKEILDNLNTLAERGVAYLVLAHFYPNKLVMPVFPYPEHLALSLIPRSKLEKVWRDVKLTDGLTGLGETVVREMCKIGMLIDISHATPKARQDIFKLVDEIKPSRPCVMATHVGAYAINPSPYNLKDWEIKWIADHGGIVGVIFMTYWLMPHETKFGMNFVSRTIEHIINVGGEDVIGIGTDFDGAIPPDDLINESQMPYLTERLFSEYKTTGERKYTNSQLEKILGGNALRVLLKGWGKL